MNYDWDRTHPEDWRPVRIAPKPKPKPQPLPRGTAKLKDSEVISLHKTGMSCIAIAHRFHVRPCFVVTILRDSGFVIERSKRKCLCGKWQCRTCRRREQQKRRKLVEF